MLRRNPYPNDEKIAHIDLDFTSSNVVTSADERASQRTISYRSTEDGNLLSTLST
jgi:hypothetical protein